MDRFTKAAIIVTILVIISNAFLIYYDIIYSNKSNINFFSIVIYRVLSVIIFFIILLLKIVFKRKVNFIFFCFFSSIFLASIFGTLSYYLLDNYDRVLLGESVHKSNIWVLIGSNILWLFMFIYLYFNLNYINKDEPIYFLKKDKLSEKLKLYKEGFVFLFVILAMLVNLFFLFKLGDFKVMPSIAAVISSLNFMLFGCIGIVAILKKSFSFYIFSVCLLTYTIFASILPTFSNFFILGPKMPFAQTVVYICVQLVSMSLIVIVSLQANAIYKKIKYKKDAI